VEGDILHEAIAVETGAFFEGNCRHSDNPLADNPPADNAPDVSAHREPAATPPAALAGTLRALGQAG
jgi:cytoskeletal protein CcmA (bactofilin family)